MLVDFQQALVDLTASPSLCIEVRRRPAILQERYCLTDREYDRLLGILRSDGMACACMVYRANRLAPLAMNMPATCRSLGPAFRGVMDAFWEVHPDGNVHFFVEADRFCRFLRERITTGLELPAAALDALDFEEAAIRAALAASRVEAGQSQADTHLIALG
jgi:hypothetical protein